MAGGPTTPELVAAVSEAGGLGTFGIHGMSVQAVRDAVRRARELTDAPIGANVLLAPPTPAKAEPTDVDRALAPLRTELGLSQQHAATPPPPSSIALLTAALEEGVSVVSTGLGDPWPVVELARAAKAPVIAMVANVADAVAAATSGADVIVAQGGEAGGHRSNFAVPQDGPVPLVGTMALVPQVVAAVDVPVIAAGGIMNGAGLVAALALGAQGAQFGSRFLLAPESGVNAAYRDRLRAAHDTDSEIITSLSGRPARGLRNRLLDVLEAAGGPSLGYPRQASAWADIRAENARRGGAEHSTLWAGQAAGLGTTDLGASEIVAQIVREAHAVIAGLHDLPR
jgi:nitronate monooxygenase